MLWPCCSVPFALQAMVMPLDSRPPPPLVQPPTPRDSQTPLQDIRMCWRLHLSLCVDSSHTHGEDPSHPGQLLPTPAPLEHPGPGGHGSFKALSHLAPQWGLCPLSPAICHGHRLARVPSPCWREGPHCPFPGENSLGSFLQEEERPQGPGPHLIASSTASLCQVKGSNQCGEGAGGVCVWV